MAAYRFQLPESGPFFNGANAAIVVAPNTTDALALVQASHPWATSAQWAAATITDLSTAKGEDFNMILNLGTAAATVTGVAAATMASMNTLLATAITNDLTLTGVSASSNVLTLGTAAAQGTVTITGSITDPFGVPITGFAPTISAAGTASATARTVTWPADTTLEWPAVFAVKVPADQPPNASTDADAIG